MNATIIINLTPEQIKQLQPLAQDLLNHFEETGERQMFAGQVLTASNGEFHRVKFGLIPPSQSEAIEQIRGLNH